jgi:hypothetical protein
LLSSSTTSLANALNRSGLNCSWFVVSVMVAVTISDLLWLSFGCACDGCWGWKRGGKGVALSLSLSQLWLYIRHHHSSLVWQWPTIINNNPITLICLQMKSYCIYLYLWTMYCHCPILSAAIVDFTAFLLIYRKTFGEIYISKNGALIQLSWTVTHI